MTCDEPALSNAKTQYHHGNLRHDLLRVAWEEIARHGSQAVSLASLARLAGVSQPAPYRHFADRDALLAAIAAEAFDRLAQSLIDAKRGHAPGEALQALGLSYVAFGEANAEVYRLMFASRLIPQAPAKSSLGRAADAAFDVLRSTIAELRPAEEVEARAYCVWAQLHGLVMLKADGFIERSLDRYVDLSGRAWLHQEPGR